MRLFQAGIAAVPGNLQHAERLQSSLIVLEKDFFVLWMIDAC
jgi:hypothetical protein